jgi:hypothetical protein
VLVEEAVNVLAASSCWFEVAVDVWRDDVLAVTGSNDEDGVLDEPYIKFIRENLAYRCLLLI